jgi:hypothetical protein
MLLERFQGTLLHLLHNKTKSISFDSSSLKKSSPQVTQLSNKWMLETIQIVRLNIFSLEFGLFKQAFLMACWTLGFLS